MLQPISYVLASTVPLIQGPPPPARHTASTRGEDGLEGP